MSSGDEWTSEEEDGDAFEVGELGQSETGGPPKRERGAPPPKFDPSKRRGSVIMLGGKQSSVSIATEVAATIRRMEAANESNDINQMQAALTSAGSVAAMAGPGDPSTAELQLKAMKLVTRLSGDESLRETAVLRRSKAVREQIRRLWDLMEMESAQMRDEQDGAMDAEGRSDVSREGYRQMHVRISRALCDPAEGFASEEKALTLADKDWAGDISRFSGTSHITVWLAAVREKFRDAAARAVGTHGFTALFKRYDADGSGELDEEEFTQAVRSDLGVDEKKLSPKDLKQLFGAVDADGSGEVDAEEFTSWLYSETKSNTKKMRQVKEKFRKASARTTEGMGWQVIFDRYDDDNSGELDVEEFTNAVRVECGLHEDAVSDKEIEELFGVIDTDQGGGIDSGELMELLEANLDDASITFGAFYSSIFELATLWADDDEEDDSDETVNNYVLFLKAVFKATAIPREHNVYFSEVELETLDVFDDEAKLRPNFKLRPLSAVQSIVQQDGTINLTGKAKVLRNSSRDVEDGGRGDSSSPNWDDLQPEPEPEVEPLQPLQPKVRVGSHNESAEGDGSKGSDYGRGGGNGQNELGEMQYDAAGNPIGRLDADGNLSMVGSAAGTIGNLLWSPVPPKEFSLHDAMEMARASAAAAAGGGGRGRALGVNSSDLAPAAARRKGCWALPWQVKYARKPGGVGAGGAKRHNDPANQRAHTGKNPVRVTRSKFLEQYNHTEGAPPPDWRRHGPIKHAAYSSSSQEYWAARRAMLIDTGVRATTSAQLASSKAVRRRQQMAVLNGAGRHSQRLPRPAALDSAVPADGQQAVAQAMRAREAAAEAAAERHRIEKMVSPFSPKVPPPNPLTSLHGYVDYDLPPGTPGDGTMNPRSLQEQTILDDDMSRPKTAAHEGITTGSEKGIGRPQTVHMVSSTTHANQTKRAISARERSHTHAAYGPFSPKAASPYSPRSPAVEKSPRQMVARRALSARSLASRSRPPGGMISPGHTARLGLDPIALMRGQTRPTAPVAQPLFLSLSPRNFEGFTGTKLESKMAQKNRPSKAAAAAEKVAARKSRASPMGVSLESGRAPSRSPQPAAGGPDEELMPGLSSWLEHASSAAGSSGPRSLLASPEMGAAAVPESVMRGSRSQGQALHPSPGGLVTSMLTVGADLRCYTPGSSKFVSVA